MKVYELESSSFIIQVILYHIDSRLADHCDAIFLKSVNASEMRN